MKRERIQTKIEFCEKSLEQLEAAYLALVSGQVQSYTIGSRSLTKFQLPELREEIKAVENELNALTEQLNGGKRRKAIGIIPRDW